MFHKVDQTTAYTIDHTGSGVIYSTAYSLEAIADRVAQKEIGFPLVYGDWQPASKREITSAGIAHNHKAMKLVFAVSDESFEDWKTAQGKAAKR